MAASIIDGKKIAAEIRTELAEEIKRLKSEKGITPGLAVILVGEDPASQSYVKAKEKACEEIGVYSDDNRLPAETTQEELLALIAKKNADPAIHGILVQLPLPKHIDTDAVIAAIDPAKDVDGFSPISVGKLMLGQPTYISCTPHGVVQLLMRSGVKIAGKEAVVVGRSNIVGKPLANLLLQKAPYGNATVTLAHTRTENLSEVTRRADILIAAAGRPNTITADMVKPGAVVIDVGVNRIADPAAPRGHRLVGDCDYAGVSEVASMITPVPGGVGPMTITMLLYNTVQSAGGNLSY
ncbi:MAG: bifunctional methylenetetrahydrofolate dehydrogenase/methenyltetrahydrofolate cyclohydrolase FolD [Victivallales bacterium]|nr:bifunctional methylenetetrahydrofolate dehydrogenase/methenyltetrahydrofolate cyclohydrolase FolD [Victivallales bacterium]